MNALTTMMLLPILGSLLVAVIPTDQVLRIKQAALGTTLLVAISGVLAWMRFDS
jgi:NADH-quinone oxidoreductase subunit M